MTSDGPQQDEPEARRREDVDEEVGRVVDAGYDVGDVERDADVRRSLDELEDELEDDPRRLAHDEDDGDDEQGTSEAPLAGGARTGAGGAEAGDLLGVEQPDEHDVEDEHDDDDDVADGEIDGRRDDLRHRRRRILPADPTIVPLRHAEHQVVAVRDADGRQKDEGDGPRPAYGAEAAGGVRVDDHHEPLEGETGDEPVGEVARHAVQVVRHAAVVVGEIERLVDETRPLEPDAKQLEVHDAQVGQSERQQVDGRAEVAHLALRQHDEVEHVRHGAGDDDR